MPDQIQTSTVELHQEEVTALAHHRPQICEVDEHLRHHGLSIRTVGDHLPSCNPLKKEQKKEPLEPTQQETRCESL